MSRNSSPKKNSITSSAEYDWLSDLWRAASGDAYCLWQDLYIIQIYGSAFCLIARHILVHRLRSLFRVLANLSSADLSYKGCESLYTPIFTLTNISAYLLSKCRKSFMLFMSRRFIACSRVQLWFMVIAVGIHLFFLIFLWSQNGIIPRKCLVSQLGITLSK